MTSLARQLLSLQAASISTKLGSDNRRKSLLWEPKDAATKDRDTVYEIGNFILNITRYRAFIYNNTS